MPRTKTEAALEDAEQKHADDGERAEVLRRARIFKTSWIELAEGLTEVRKLGLWQRWGYASFDEYTKNELYLRPETVDKLTGSFQFLRKKAPDVLDRDGVRERIPTYQAVDFLRRAEEQPDAPRDVVDEIRKRVIDENAPLPTVSRAFREVVFPESADDRKSREGAALRSTAKRLAELLERAEDVDDSLKHRVSAALERLIDVLAKQDERAALRVASFATTWLPCAPQRGRTTE
jgi:hypothetical protein